MRVHQGFRRIRHGDWSGKEVALPPLPPLRTGRETFASSGSSRCQAPRGRSRSTRCDRVALTILACSLLALAHTPSSFWVLCFAWPTGAHVELSTFICNSRLRGFSLRSRHERPCRKSARLRGRVMLQLLSTPLQDGIGFLQRSVAPHPVSLPCGRPSSEEERYWVYHVPLKQLGMI